MQPADAQTETCFGHLARQREYSSGSGSRAMAADCPECRPGGNLPARLSRMTDVRHISSDHEPWPPAVSTSPILHRCSCRSAHRQGRVMSVAHLLVVAALLVSAIAASPSASSAQTRYCSAYSATNTDSARQNYRTCAVSLGAGNTIDLGTCGVSGSQGSGDTFLRLFNPNGQQVMEIVRIRPIAQ
ncbi:MAG: hypothetical protein HYV63_19705 [Candidatus Schekmanbacteria bacterium]|nr:hypothetical protein [Candidatus Schekmanbacteria bacterium]